MIGFCVMIICLFFFKQKTAYEMRISDWSSDVCSSDLWRDTTRPVQPGAICRHRPVQSGFLLLSIAHYGGQQKSPDNGPDRPRQVEPGYYRHAGAQWRFP